MKRKTFSFFLTLVLVIGVLIPSVPTSDEKQSDRQNSDFVTELTSVDSGVTTLSKKLIDLYTNWKYLDDNTDPADGYNTLDAWTNIDFDDSAWKNGVGSFCSNKGELDSPIYTAPDAKTLLTLYQEESTTPIQTYFFRTKFTLDSLTDYNALSFEVYANDAIVIYLNGVAVCDSRKTTNDTTNLYYSEGKWQERQFKVYFDDVKDILNEGENVISVELHNKSKSSRDAYFAIKNMSCISYTPSVVCAEDVVMSIGSSETERNLAWLSTIEESGEVRVVKASEINDGIFPTTYTSFSASSVTAANAFDKYAKKATVSGLEENTDYAYVFAAGNAESKIYYFSVGSFDDFEFVFLGDPQISSEKHASAWKDTMEKITSEFNTDIVISAGDQINATDSEQEYSYLVVDELSGVAFMPTVGPYHETPGVAFGDHYNLPNLSTKYGVNETSANYWYTYNNTLFMHLNVSDSSAYTNGEHKNFIKAAIAANPDATWKIVVMHHSLYSTGEHGDEATMVANREAFAPILTELGIDIVLSGHDHIYLRTSLMNGTEPSDDVVENNVAVLPNGTLYVCANSSTGSKFYTQQYFNGNFVAKDNYEKRKSAIKFDVNDTSITMTSYFLDDMSVFDTFTISNRDKNTLSDNVSVVGKSVSLGELIDMNFYVKVENGYTGTATLTCGSKSVTIDIYSLTPDTEGRYKLSIPLTSIDMSKDVVLNVDGGTYKTSIKEYAEQLILLGGNATERKIAKSLLNYGAYAQQYFADYKNDLSLLDLLANAGLSDADKIVEDITASDLADYKIVCSGATTDVHFTSAAFVLASKTKIKLYFVASENAVVTVNGTEYEKFSDNGEYYITLTVSNPTEAPGAFEIQIEDNGATMWASLSAYSVIELALSNSSMDEKFVALLKAYFAYCESTISYAYSIIYNTNGGILPENVPTSYDPKFGVTLPEISKNGYVFSGWYTTSTFDKGTKINAVEVGNRGQITVYAKWCQVLEEVVFEEHEITNSSSTQYLQNSAGKDICALGYKSGVTYKVVSDENNQKYLEWSLPGTSSRPEIDFRYNGSGWKNVDDNCISFSLELARDASGNCAPFRIRLRQTHNTSGGASTKDIALIKVSKAGKIQFSDNSNIATIDAGSSYTLRIVIDMEDLQVRAYNEDYSLIGNYDFTINGVTKGETSLETIKACFQEELINLYADKDVEGVLRIYNVKSVSGDMFAE